MSAHTRESLLAQIAAIEHMEPGKLCVIRQGPNGPYFNLQCRQAGKTITRYVARPQLEMAQTHTANYERFFQLIEEYVQLVGEQSRALREGQPQKKRTPPSRSPRTRKSAS